MAELHKSITDARKELPTLAQAVEDGSDRVYITNRGEPQAVLLGIEEFKGMRAAVELMNRPREFERLRAGLADRKRIGFADLEKSIAAQRAGARSQVEQTAEALPVEVGTMAAIEQNLNALKRRIDQLLEHVVVVSPDLIPAAAAYFEADPEQWPNLQEGVSQVDDQLYFKPVSAASGASRKRARADAATIPDYIVAASSPAAAPLSARSTPSPRNRKPRAEVSASLAASLKNKTVSSE